MFQNSARLVTKKDSETKVVQKSDPAERRDANCFGSLTCRKSDSARRETPLFVTKSEPITSLTRKGYLTDSVGSDSGPERQIVRQQVVGQAMTAEAAAVSKGGKKKPLPGGLVSKAQLGNSNESDGKNTDTMEEDPSVDSLKPPKKFHEALTSKTDLKKPRRFAGAQRSPMNSEKISASMTAANS